MPGVAEATLLSGVVAGGVVFGAAGGVVAGVLGVVVAEVVFDAGGFDVGGVVEVAEGVVVGSGLVEASGVGGLVVSGLVVDWL